MRWPKASRDLRAERMRYRKPARLIAFARRSEVSHPRRGPASPFTEPRHRLIGGWRGGGERIGEGLEVVQSDRRERLPCPRQNLRKTHCCLEEEQSRRKVESLAQLGDMGLGQFPLALQHFGNHAGCTEQIGRAHV